MSEQPPRPPDGEHTTWDWLDDPGVWAEREMTPEEYEVAHPPVVVPPRPQDTETSTWDLVDNQWVERPWTPEELAEQAVVAARQAARLVIKAIVTDLQAEKERVQVVLDKPNADITGGDTKNVGRAVKRVADAAIDLARFVGD